jgi:hypothetical protein
MSTLRIRMPHLRSLLVVVALLFALAPASQAAAAPDNPAADEAQFVALINSTRSSHGLPALKVDGQLTSLARDWSAQQAEVGKISHASPISAGVTADWVKLGENVGTGGSVKPVMVAFIASPPPLANILDPKFTRIGVGVVWNGNALYTTHRFMALADEPTAVAPPEAEPTPEAPATPEAPEVPSTPAPPRPRATPTATAPRAPVAPVAPVAPTPTPTLPPVVAPSATAPRAEALLNILHSAYS